MPGAALPCPAPTAALSGRKLQCELRAAAAAAAAARRPRIPARLRRLQQRLHLLQAPGDLLKVGQEPGAVLPRAVQHLGVFR